MKKLLLTILICIIPTLSVCQEIPYKEWRKTLTEDNGYRDAYFLPKNTIVARHRPNFIRGYNYAVNNSNLNLKSFESRFNCHVTRGWSVARIIKRTKGSNVVMIEYEVPFSTYVHKKWVHSGTIEPLKKALGKYVK